MARRPASRLAAHVLWVAATIFALTAGMALAASGVGGHTFHKRVKLSGAQALGGVTRCVSARSKRINPAAVRHRRGGCKGADASRTPQPLYWGAAIGDHVTGEQAPWDMNAVTTFEREAGKSASLVHFFQPFAICEPDCDFYEFPTMPMESIRAHG